MPQTIEPSEVHQNDIYQYYLSLKTFFNITGVKQEDRSSSSRAKKARSKLLKLSVSQFYELSTDVSDELKRRLDEAQNQPEYLLPKASFHVKRNQARQKLANLSQIRFNELVDDILYEIERRGFDKKPQHISSNANTIESSDNLSLTNAYDSNFNSKPSNVEVPDQESNNVIKGDDIDENDNYEKAVKDKASDMEHTLPVINLPDEENANGTATSTIQQSLVIPHKASIDWSSDEDDDAVSAVIDIANDNTDSEIIPYSDRDANSIEKQKDTDLNDEAIEKHDESKNKNDIPDLNAAREMLPDTKKSNIPDSKEVTTPYKTIPDMDSFINSTPITEKKDLELRKEIETPITDKISNFNKEHMKLEHEILVDESKYELPVSATSSSHLQNEFLSLNSQIGSLSIENEHLKQKISELELKLKVSSKSSKAAVNSYEHLLESGSLSRYISDEGKISLELVDVFQNLLSRSFEILDIESNNNHALGENLFQNLSQIIDTISQIIESINANEFRDSISILKATTSHAITSVRYYSIYTDLIPKVVVQSSISEVAFAVADLISLAKLNVSKDRIQNLNKKNPIKIDTSSNLSVNDKLGVTRAPVTPNVTLEPDLKVAPSFPINDPEESPVKPLKITQKVINSPVSKPTGLGLSTRQPSVSGLLNMFDSRTNVLENENVTSSKHQTPLTVKKDNVSSTTSLSDSIKENNTIVNGKTEKDSRSNSNKDIEEEENIVSIKNTNQIPVSTKKSEIVPQKFQIPEKSIQRKFNSIKKNKLERPSDKVKREEEESKSTLSSSIDSIFGKPQDVPTMKDPIFDEKKIQTKDTRNELNVNFNNNISTSQDSDNSSVIKETNDHHVKSLSPIDTNANAANRASQDKLAKSLADISNDTTDAIGHSFSSMMDDVEDVETETYLALKQNMKKDKSADVGNHIIKPIKISSVQSSSLKVVDMTSNQMTGPVKNELLKNQSLNHSEIMQDTSTAQDKPDTIHAQNKQNNILTKGKQDITQAQYEHNTVQTEDNQETIPTQNKPEAIFIQDRQDANRAQEKSEIIQAEDRQDMTPYQSEQDSIQADDKQDVISSRSKLNAMVEHNENHVIPTEGKTTIIPPRHEQDIANLSKKSIANPDREFTEQNYTVNKADTVDNKSVDNVPTKSTTKNDSSKSISMVTNSLDDSVKSGPNNLTAKFVTDNVTIDNHNKKSSNAGNDVQPNSDLNSYHSRSEATNNKDEVYIKQENNSSDFDEENDISYQFVPLHKAREIKVEEHDDIAITNKKDKYDGEEKGVEDEEEQEEEGDEDDEEEEEEDDDEEEEEEEDFDVDAFDIENPDNTLSELLLYLEHQTVQVISTIQSLLSSIKEPQSTKGNLRRESNAINQVIGQMAGATSISMNQSRNANLKKHGSWVVQSLEDCGRRMTTLCHLNSDGSIKYDTTDDDYADKNFKQRLAGIAFDVAKCTKELVKTVEEASLKEEIEYLNSRLN